MEEEEGDAMLRAIRANNIADYDVDRGKKPTREDVGNLLKDEEGKVFYFKITYNHSTRKMDEKEYAEIEEHLYKEYRLYKMKSTIDSEGNKEGQTLSRSTYVAFINHEQAIGIVFVQAIVKMLKKSIFELKVDDRDLPLDTDGVHVLASMAIAYQEKNEEKGEEDGGGKEGEEKKEEDGGGKEGEKKEEEKKEEKGKEREEN
ncbi:PREDICTED: uncharacterized protein LOC109580233 [Amphimedon queenslandica]|uniref:Uncharacterized protein n=1 Tax=Amphimedon queenslandica TaxID=400682 RepID=A0A1X7VIZ9_AMPQE|nr:PREDICTED: uncharacterized protein LOC109580233 [Amphimedon queenslandica]|eukprot:XP_019848750.1 PREDICTED: uncharacterized protein LOC109580233 [Amphimedon queenslandica]